MPLKKCRICKEEKELAKYPPHTQTKDKCQSYCRDCRHKMNEKARRAKGIISRDEYLKKVMIPHRTKKERRFLSRQKRKLKYINLLGNKCSRCGIILSKMWPPSCFEFHHVNGKRDKEDTIGAFLSLSDKRALIELEKCVLVCANCHRAIHFPATEADGLSG